MNVCKLVSKGLVATAFTGALAVVPMALAEDGMATIWCSSQGHFQIRDLTGLVLGVPVSQIKVIPMEIGGGFGGKTVIYLEPVAAVLSGASLVTRPPPSTRHRSWHRGCGRSPARAAVPR